MPETVRTTIVPDPACASRGVGFFLSQLDAQRNTLLELTRDLPPEILSWQPEPGMNTIGMLLAHIAYAENHLVSVGIEGKATSDTKTAIGLSVEEEGMPLAAGAPPSPALMGKDVAFFHGLLARARMVTRRVATELSETDLARIVVRERPDGAKREFDVAWVFYHLLEHEAGHRGQIALLIHQWHARQAGPA